MTSQTLEVGGNVDDLFAQTLQGEYESELPWKAIGALRRLGTREVFERAAAWCRDEDPLKRARGADILAQLGRKMDGNFTHSFPEESFKVLSDLIAHERDLVPLCSVIAALGHLRNPLAVPLVASYVNHPESRVRFEVSFALGCFPNEPQSVAGLVQLTGDSDDETRDWATFGLGVIGDADSPEIRDALLNRLNDPYQNVRDEAMSGLGKRRDPRVLEALLDSLRKELIADPVIEAAYLLLGLEEEPADWTPAHYIQALEERFQR
jgi:HEAT repeat protein